MNVLADVGKLRPREDPLYLYIFQADRQGFHGGIHLRTKGGTECWLRDYQEFAKSKRSMGLKMVPKAMLGFSSRQIAHPSIS